MRFRLVDGRDLSINHASFDSLINAVTARLRVGEGFSVATLNLDHLVKLRESVAFRDAYVATDFVVADGNPIVWLSRLAGRRVELVPGSELVMPLCALTARLSVPVALYGSDAATLTAVAGRLEALHPGLRVVWQKAPPFGFDPAGPDATRDAVAIGASGARLCFIALGAPRQEIFAVRARSLAPACGFVSIGAGLDFIVGAQIRAPVWMQRLALEWFWRLLGNPRRLAGRYAACAVLLPRLVVDAARERVGAEGRRSLG